MTKTGKRGFALILTLFLVVALTGAAVASFLNSGRRSRTAVQTVDHVQMTWVAEGAIDRTIQMFYDYIRSRGLPRTTNAEKDVNDPDHVLTEFDSAGTFATYLGYWYDGFKDRHSDVMDPLALSATIVDITIGSEVSAADYRITITLTNSRLGETRVYTQDLHVAAGRLFDFGVFYDKDLEIAPGPDWVLQGPIFTNGNVYLMSGQNHTLRLKAPPSGGPEDYVLRAHGHIYFYFKTAVAPNYLLENPYYRKIYPSDAFRASGADPNTGRGGVEIAMGQAGAPHTFFPRSPNVKGRSMNQPFNYVFSNESVYCADSVWSMGWVNRSTIEVVDKDWTVSSIASGSNSLGFLVRPDWQRIVENPTLIYSDQFFPSAGVSNYRAPTVFTAYAKGYDAGTPVYGENSEYSPGSHLSNSAAIDFTNLRKPDSDWSLTNQKCTDPFVNKYWAGLTTANGVVVSEQVAHKFIPVGNQDNPDYHSLIEPLLIAGENFNVARYKYQTYANVVLKCENSDCSSYSTHVDQMTQDPAHPGTWRLADPVGDHLKTEVTGGALVDLGVTRVVSFFDYRLQGSYNMLTIDVDKLRKELDATYHIQSVIMYVQTNRLERNERYGSSYGPSVAPDMVRLTNGAKIPKGGFSFITNGRLWVQGDYNTYPPPPPNPLPGGTDTWNPCTTFDQITAGTCVPPPADLYSDSFGVLSAQWSDTNGVDTPTSSRVVTDAQGLILNAGVVTGTLPSQLVKAKYVHDDGAPWHEHPMANVDIDLATDCSDKIDDKHNFITSCNTSSHEVLSDKHVLLQNLGEFRFLPADACPAGLNPDGTPIDPQHCFYTADPEGPNYVYYWNKSDLGPYSQNWRDLFAQIKNTHSLYYRFTQLEGHVDGDGHPDDPPITVDYGAGTSKISIPTTTVGIGKEYDRECAEDAFAASVKNIPLCVDLHNPPFTSNPADSYSKKQFIQGSPTDPLDPDTSWLSPDNVAKVPLITADLVNGFSNNPVAPYPTAPYPGIAVANLNKDAFSSFQPSYSCHNGIYVSTRYKGASCKLIGENLTCDGVTKDQLLETRGCVCDDVGHIYTHTTNDGYMLPPTQILTGGFPTQWAPSEFLGSGVCPLDGGIDKNNEFAYGSVPYPYYSGPYYLPLYEPKYSGGLENLINLQEDWVSDGPQDPVTKIKTPIPFHFFGVLIVPWDSLGLVTSSSGTPAFYSGTYYNPPVRDYVYNAGLRTNPPPLPTASNQQLFAVSRRKFSEKSQN